MRHSLEPQACALAALNGTDEQKQRFRNTLDEMAALQVAFNRERWIETDMAYHELIYEMSGNPFMTAFASLFRSIYYNYFTSITHNQVIKPDIHQAIADAILSSQSEEAYRACQSLLQATASQEI